MNMKEMNSKERTAKSRFGIVYNTNPSNTENGLCRVSTMRQITVISKTLVTGARNLVHNSKNSSDGAHSEPHR